MPSQLLPELDQQILVEKLKELVLFVSNNFNYYRKSLKNINFDQIQKLSDLNKFPILERKKIMDSDLISEVLANNPPAYFETSGTTGNPFPVIPNLSVEKSQEFADFMNNWMSLESDNVRKAIIALPFEMNPVGIKYFLGLSKLNITSIPAGVRTHLCTPDKVLEIINRLKPELLIGRPLEILRYAEAMQLQGIDPAQSSVRKIIYTGEIVSKNKWKRMKAIYGNAQVSGIYGLTEVDSSGLISCEKNGYKYHLPKSPYLIVELLHDDFTTSVKDGEIGNIVFTNTEKNYFPLVRYNTGDKGKLHSKCDCGFPTPAIEIMGRQTDCIHTDTGEIYPIQIENILFSNESIGSEYQILSYKNKVTLRIEVKSNSNFETDKIVSKLKNEIFEILKLNVEIDVYPFGMLANKLGIAKEKAGKLYLLDDLSENEIQNKLKINYC